jgi:O-acetyl-ADP-ribose deacetylase (regulator of RNase III)
VGPRQGEGNERAKLAGAVRSSLELADRHSLSSIAIPAISSGIFGIPMDFCARVLLETAVEYLEYGEHSLLEVEFCLFDSSAMEAFAKSLGEIVADRAEK